MEVSEKKSVITKPSLRKAPCGIDHSKSVSRVLTSCFGISEFSKKDIKRFIEKLPLVVINRVSADSECIHASFVSESKKNAGKFFYEMISRWVIPTKVLSVSHFFLSDFTLEGSDKTLLSGEIVVPLASNVDSIWLETTLRVLSDEIKLGLRSPYNAAKILEIKGFSTDEKLTWVQEEVSMLVEKFPQRYDFDLYSLMQEIFLLTKIEFKTIRGVRDLTRIICGVYLLRKLVTPQIESDPNHRVIQTLFKQVDLNLPLGQKKALGVFVGLNFLNENEFFGKKQLARAMESMKIKARPFDESYIEIGHNDLAVHLYYLEFTKNDGSDFSQRELQKLKKEFSGQLNSRIEKLMKPIFMPRNEEEVMKNIVLLSHQIKFIRDIPQVMINFSEQTFQSLVFVVVLVRVCSRECLPFHSVIRLMEGECSVEIERERKVGHLRGKYPKEAVVLKVGLKSAPYLRDDGAIDLYRARTKVFSEVQKAFGVVRDFNGGMIAKQKEALDRLEGKLRRKGPFQRSRLEDFFHSLFPVESRVIVSTDYLLSFFQGFLKLLGMTHNRGVAKVQHAGEGFGYILVKSTSPCPKEKIGGQIMKLEVPSRDLVNVNFRVNEFNYFGFMYLSNNRENIVNFLEKIDHILDF